ncbi:hypothetical protein Tco_0273419 [Tanacetum coccineum]
MKSLAKSYFGFIDGQLTSQFGLSHRQEALLSCVRAPHAHDFLSTIPIDGLGQRMNPRQFRAVLCYHICSKVGVSVRKEVPMGFLSSEGCDLLPADLLLYNWSNGKDACPDVTGVSHQSVFSAPHPNKQKK